MSVLIGPWGDLRQVRCTVAPAQVSHDAQATRVKALDGTLHVQLPPSDRRAWAWSLVWVSAADLSWLVQLEQGVHGDEYHFYEPIAASVNMLRPGSATPGIEPNLGGWVVSGIPSASLDVPQRGVIRATGNGGYSPAVPVVPGRTYTAAIENTGAGDQEAYLVTQDAAGGTLGADEMGPFPTPPGQRATLTTTPVAGAAAVRIQLLGGTEPEQSWTRPQITETPAAVPWQPGMGIPRVVLSGVVEGYRAVAFGTRRDHSVTIIEVG